MWGLQPTAWTAVPGTVPCGRHHTCPHAVPSPGKYVCECVGGDQGPHWPRHHAPHTMLYGEPVQAPWPPEEPQGREVGLCELSAGEGEFTGCAGPATLSKPGPAFPSALGPPFLSSCPLPAPCHQHLNPEGGGMKSQRGGAHSAEGPEVGRVCPGEEQRTRGTKGDPAATVPPRPARGHLCGGTCPAIRHLPGTGNAASPSISQSLS